MKKTFIILFLIIFCSFKMTGQDIKKDTINQFDSLGLKTGLWITYSSSTEQTRSVLYYVRGKKNGLCKFYTDNGILQNEIEYKNDLIDGLFKHYTIYGKYEISEYKNNIQEGVSKFYNYKGILIESSEYKNNILNGKKLQYSLKTGRVIMESNFINGKENGTRRSFSDNEKKEIIVEADFAEDIRVERRFYKRGKLIKVIKDEIGTQAILK